MTPIRTSVLLAALLAAALPLQAQEVLVPWDEAGRVEVIDQRLAQRLGVFVDEYPGFREARLFQAAEGSYVLEITTVQEGRTSRQRHPLSGEEAGALRSRVQEMLAARAPEEGIEHAGRNRLLGTTALMGTLFYGWAVPVALDVESASAFTALYMLIAGGSFFLPWSMTADQPVSWGMEQAASYGATRGIAHGLALHYLIFGEPPVGPERTYCDGWGCETYHDPHPDEGRHLRRAIGFAVLTSVTEGIAGYTWARRNGIDGGHAATVGLMGDAGLLGGLFTAMLIDTEDVRVVSGLVAGSSAAGLLGGLRYGRVTQHTMGDVGVMRTTAALGLQAAGSALAVADTDSPRAAGALLLAGGAAGLVFGHAAVKETNFTTAQSGLIGLAAAAGAFVGGGLGWMIEGDESDGRLISVLATAGAIGGFLPMYRRYAEEARTQPYITGRSFRTSLAPVVQPVPQPGGMALRTGLRLDVHF